MIVSKLDSRTAMELETCIHCGMCSEACHFYEATQDAKYTPIHKVHLVRSVYRRELSPMRWFNRLFTREITAAGSEQLAGAAVQLLHGMRPLRPDVSDGHSDHEWHSHRAPGARRGGPDAAGTARTERRTDPEATPCSASAPTSCMRRCVNSAVRGIVVPLDQPKADVLLLTTVSDLLLYRQSFAAIARILDKLALSWTIRSEAFEASNFGVLSGSRRRTDARGQADHRCGSHLWGEAGDRPGMRPCLSGVALRCTGTTGSAVALRSHGDLRIHRSRDQGRDVSR